MTTMFMLLATTCLVGATGPDDTCCSQGKANPWKNYNKGVQWAVGLSKESSRWADLKDKKIDVARGSSLAERQAIFKAPPKSNPKTNWEQGLQPALDRARKEGKLVMFFQLVGDLDLAGC